MPKAKRKKPSCSLKSIPWEQLRAAYLADSTLTLVAVAKRFSVAVRLVRDRAATEKWRTLREECDRTTGEELWKAAKQKIADLAGANALAYLADLRRMNSAIADRYLKRLDEPELKRKVTQGGLASGDGVPIGEQLEEERVVPVNLPKFAAKMLELERQALKDFLGIEEPKSGASMTVEETKKVTIDLSR